MFVQRLYYSTQHYKRQQYQLKKTEQSPIVNRIRALLLVGEVQPVQRHGGDAGVTVEGGYGAIWCIRLIEFQHGAIRWHKRVISNDL